MKAAAISAVRVRALALAEAAANAPALIAPELPGPLARFGLTATEASVLWTLLAHELCPQTRQLLRALGTEEASDPSTDVLRRVAYPDDDTAAWRELGGQGALRRFGLIRATDAAEVPEHRQTWTVGARVLALLHGEPGLDTELADIASLAEDPGELTLPEGYADRLAAAFARGGLVLVHGRPGHGRRSSLIAAATARGLSVLHVDARALSPDKQPLRAQLRAIARECRLLGTVPLIEELDAVAALDVVESELTGLVLATAARPIPRRWKRVPSTVELGKLSTSQRVGLWARALPFAGDKDCELLATMYPLAPSLIAATADHAIACAGGEPMRPEHIVAGLRLVLDDRLAGFATRVNVTQTWQDLVLPEDQAVAISELLARIRERRRVYEDWGFATKVGKGLGVAALFSGPPGTGKTMAAGLIARSLNAELYQVDLSKIVSKWIGETEKNLAALFDAAEAGHAILLFDEADALFGKRTDVKSSNDRHANQETNYLLQRLESFEGICILTTNHETSLDEAFRRRLSIHVRFPMPEATERARLWRAMLPARAPTSGDLKLESLATKYIMSGGYIRNAVLRAAFIAADENAAIDASRLARAAQLEYEALGKVISRS